jgi:hypothetical protein
VAIILKYGNLNLLETSGPVQACNRTALPLPLTLPLPFPGHDIFKVVTSVIWLGCKAVIVVTIGTKVLEELSLKMKTDGNWLHYK